MGRRLLGLAAREGSTLDCPLTLRREDESVRAVAPVNLAAMVAVPESVAAGRTEEAKVVVESALVKEVAEEMEVKSRAPRTYLKSSATTVSSMATTLAIVLNPRRTHRQGAAPLALLQLPVAPVLLMPREVAVEVAAEVMAKDRDAMAAKVARRLKAHRPLIERASATSAASLLQTMTRIMGVKSSGVSAMLLREVEKPTTSRPKTESSMSVREVAP